MQEYFDANRQLWDNKVKYHEASKMYDIPGFLAGKEMLNSIELDALPDVNGKSMLHLQCHFGQDSLCWARRGAKVTGVDLSSKALELARELNAKMNKDVRFVESNIMELIGKIEKKFDIVFTSYGTYGWLPDLKTWAQVIYHYLKPGGIFYIADFHPVLYLYDFESKSLKYDYFNTGEAIEEIVEGTYADKNAPLKDKEYFWCHSLSEIISPLLEEGMQMIEFKEFDYSPYNCFENMTEIQPGKYAFDIGIKLPHLFSLKMRKQ